MLLKLEKARKFYFYGGTGSCTGRKVRFMSFAPCNFKKHSFVQILLNNGCVVCSGLSSMEYVPLQSLGQQMNWFK